MGFMRRVLFTSIVLVSAWLSLSAQTPALRTMRVDYFHTGGTSPEVFALDEVAIEPAPWPGPARPREDTLRYGAYGFDVRDAATKQIVYSAGFGSVFDEWVTTEEAKMASRTFHESVRFPAPPSPVTLTIRKRGASNAWQDVWTTTIDPKDMFVNTAAPAPDPGSSSSCRRAAIRRQGRSPDARRRLHRGRAREVRARRAAAGRHAVRDLAVQGAARDINVWGLSPAAGAVGHLAAVAAASTGARRSAPPTTRSIPSATC